MKTAELIQIARKCGQRTTDCKNCPLDGKEDCRQYLFKELADKLEMAVEDLNKQQSCETCRDREMPAKEHTRCWKCGLRHWRWRGDRDE